MIPEDKERRIYELIGEGELLVRDIARRLSLSTETVSKRFVRYEEFYRLDEDTVGRVMVMLKSNIPVRAVAIKLKIPVDGVDDG
jgi:predicted transcriptional regulator